ncbi:hypothetical protein BDV18DRAFT_155441 [Aspergillus unguis]
MALRTLALALCAATFLSPTSAQNPSGTPLTDEKSNITFSTWTIPASTESKTGPLTFGLTLPPDATTTDVYDLIGYLSCAPQSSWCGISLGGAMTDSLLVVAFADTENGNVKHSLRYTTEYSLPQVYEGNATLSVIRSEVGDDSFTSVFLCRDCLRWEQGKSSGSAKTSSGNLDLAWAINEEGPGDGECADQATLKKHSAQGTWVGFVNDGVVSEGFEELAKGAQEEDKGC